MFLWAFLHFIMGQALSVSLPYRVASCIVRTDTGPFMIYSYDDCGIFFLQFITEGYASHLAQLEYSHRSRPAKNTNRIALRKGSFCLPGQSDFLRKRNHLLRTISSQPTTSSNHKPERTQSQSESERDREKERSQRSMSIAAGCWGRSGVAPKLDSVVLSQK